MQNLSINSSQLQSYGFGTGCQQNQRYVKKDIAIYCAHIDNQSKGKYARKCHVNDRPKKFHPEIRPCRPWGICITSIAYPSRLWKEQRIKHGQMYYYEFCLFLEPSPFSYVDSRRGRGVGLPFCALWLSSCFLTRNRMVGIEKTMIHYRLQTDEDGGQGLCRGSTNL